MDVIEVALQVIFVLDRVFSKLGLSNSASPVLFFLERLHFRSLQPQGNVA